MKARVWLLLCLLLASGQVATAAEQLPQSLGQLVLGKAAPREYLAGKGDETVHYVNKSALREMWPALAPGLPDAVEGGTVTSYKGRVAQVIFSLRYDMKFEAVHSYLAQRFGKGQKANVRTPSTGARNCPPFYRVQKWSEGGRTLELVSDTPTGGQVILRQDDLVFEMEQDPDKERDHEPCLE